MRRKEGREGEGREGEGGEGREGGGDPGKERGGEEEEEEEEEEGGRTQDQMATSWVRIHGRAIQIEVSQVSRNRGMK